jgi:mannose-1-phosphate guanylyltransferase
MSRKALPKPFLPLLGEQTLNRVTGSAHFASPIMVAGVDHAALIKAQIGQASAVQIVIEPAPKNTAPAIALAAALMPEDAALLVCPSDHHVIDSGAFRAEVTLLAAQR